MLSTHSAGTYQGKLAHTQLVRKHSATFVSACWATVDWSWPKKLNRCDLHFTTKTNKQKSAGLIWIVKEEKIRPKFFQASKKQLHAFEVKTFQAHVFRANPLEQLRLGSISFTANAPEAISFWASTPETGNLILTLEVTPCHRRLKWRLQNFISGRSVTLWIA